MSGSMAGDRGDTRHADRFDRTIDWDGYWAEADEDDREGASPSAEYVLEPMCAYLEETGSPASFADVGCGAGALAFDVASRHPDATVVGYDAAESVLAENRIRARERELDALRFERTVLPAFDPGRQFDVVASFYTLCYVADVETALQALYDAVAPGGSLVLGYHNRLASAQFRRVAEDPEGHLGEDSPWDPDRFEDRFELLLAGENLLSYERIHDALGTWPRSLFAHADAVERHPAWRHNPFVSVPK